MASLGFPQGRNIAVRTATSFDQRTYEAVDQADQLSCRPDFFLLLYPVYLTLPNKATVLDPSIEITTKCPPMFFAHTGDDPIPAQRSILLYLALEAARVMGSELHIYPFGGHGYGRRPSKHAVSTWPDRAKDRIHSLSF